MTLTDTVILIGGKGVQGPNGYMTIDEKRTEALVEVKSVRRSEFYEAQRVGTRLVIAFELWGADYGGQPFLEHDGTRYKVERTYSEGDTVELNCSEVVSCR